MISLPEWTCLQYSHFILVEDYNDKMKVFPQVRGVITSHHHEFKGILSNSGWPTDIKAIVEAILAPRELLFSEPYILSSSLTVQESSNTCHFSDSAVFLGII